MNKCKICNGDGAILNAECYSCQGTGLPVNISNNGQEYLEWNKRKKNEYYLIVYFRKTMKSLDGYHNLTIENGNHIRTPLTQKQINKMIDDVNNNKIESTEINICANSLEEAKREAIEICNGFGDIVVEVTERDYSGWGIKNL